MSTYSHTAIATGADANASTINTPLGALDAAIGNLASLGTTDKTAIVAALNEVRNQAVVAGANVTNAQLIAWAEGESYEMTTITRDANGTITSATVKWPDTSAGTFTGTTINTTWLAVDAYTITHTTASKTVTQTAVTRDANGDVTTKPAITVV